MAIFSNFCLQFYFLVYCSISVHYIYLIFCMKLETIRGYKLTPFFIKVLVWPFSVIFAWKSTFLYIAQYRFIRFIWNFAWSYSIFPFFQFSSFLLFYFSSFLLFYLSCFILFHFCSFLFFTFSTFLVFYFPKILVF